MNHDLPEQNREDNQVPPVNHNHQENETILNHNNEAPNHNTVNQIINGLNVDVNLVIQQNHDITIEELNQDVNNTNAPIVPHVLPNGNPQNVNQAPMVPQAFPNGHPQNVNHAHRMLHPRIRNPRNPKCYIYDAYTIIKNKIIEDNNRLMRTRLNGTFSNANDFYDAIDHESFLLSDSLDYFYGSILNILNNNYE